VALPEQLFYNTGIATYVWVLTNRKAPARQGKVQLIDATSFWVPMRKSLGDKRREIPPDRAAQILRLLHAFEENEYSKIFPTTHFGFRKITVKCPLRLNFHASPERLGRLKDESAFQKLAVSKKRDAWAKSVEEADGQALQQSIRAMLSTLPDALFQDRNTFLKALHQVTKQAGLKLSASVQKAILSALSERDETAAICRDKDEHPEPDPELRGTESVPLTKRIEDFFAREVHPHVPNAWINTPISDEKDGGVGGEVVFARMMR
jgi:type I restriction enzyme M protein